MSTTVESTSGYALIDELAASRLFGDYVSAFPNASRDAGNMLRVAVQVGLVDCYQELLECALRAKRPVPQGDWHALLAQVPWPRPLPEWDRAPIEQWRLDMNPDATPNWPESCLGGCHIGSRHGDPWKRTGLPGWLFDDSPTRREAFPWSKSLIKVVAIAVCVSIVGLALPSRDTIDFWVAMAAVAVALLAAAL